MRQAVHSARVFRHAAIVTLVLIAAAASVH